MLFLVPHRCCKPLQGTQLLLRHCGRDPCLPTPWRLLPPPTSIMTARASLLPSSPWIQSSSSTCIFLQVKWPPWRPLPPLHGDGDSDEVGRSSLDLSPSPPPPPSPLDLRDAAVARVATSSGVLLPPPSGELEGDGPRA